jgi:hypothetical protein
MSQESTKARYAAEYYSANIDKYRVLARAGHMRRKFGLTIAQIDAMLERQGGKCAICRTDTPGGRGRFHVDHCHATGRVRGLLCSDCNLGLGRFKDDTELLQTAADYIAGQKQGTNHATL